MTSLCGGVHTISINERNGNVHTLLRRVNKIACGQVIRKKYLVDLLVPNLPICITYF
ncbi:hypothetical protein RHMOL_Rhmol10G0103000 [Rhododendron molle]|uniref:Uncharacterized protein n=1 Tax=Rhododendron molle TaxID=49168 RepID=A0ACC0M150_RHOML|nr:hypothetical protein RHMOL_Rhmol10G0103000 [Rhododendron molle]